MSNAPELLPCPFCGENGGEYFTHGHRIQCICQDPSTDSRACVESERAKGVDLWNTRADLPPKVKALEWRNISRHPDRYESECGEYKVYDSGHDGPAFGYKSDDPCGFTYTYHFDMGSAAFDAAQAHHEARVLACLEASHE